MQPKKYPVISTRDLILPGTGFLAICSTLTLFVGGFFGLAAWSDYEFRGCAMGWGQQCDDASKIMIFGALLSLVSLVVAVLTYWIFFHTLRKGSDHFDD